MRFVCKICKRFKLLCDCDEGNALLMHEVRELSKQAHALEVRLNEIRVTAHFDLDGVRHMHEALKELVALKTLKDTCGKTADYYARKVRAWEYARWALDKLTATTKLPNKASEDNRVQETIRSLENDVADLVTMRDRREGQIYDAVRALGSDAEWTNMCDLGEELLELAALYTHLYELLEKHPPTCHCTDIPRSDCCGCGAYDIACAVARIRGLGGHHTEEEPVAE